MTLEEVFYMSQSIASVAVVGSLIYLGLQVRGAGIYEEWQKTVRAMRSSPNS